MARYLFNTITNPLKVNTAVRCYLDDGIESNPGDMVYTHAVMNTVCRSSKDEFVPTGYYNFSGRCFVDGADWVNRECSAFIMPFANMFNRSWIWFLNRYAELIRRLTIPVIMPCVGVTDSDCPWDSETAEAVGGFMRLVLDRSAVVGVRGESTAKCLKAIGFAEGKDFVVLGCPSIYMYGRKLPEIGPVRKFDRCAISMNARSPAAHWRFIDGCRRLFKDFDYVAQNHDEFYHYMFSNRAMMRIKFKLNPEFNAFLSEYAAGDHMRFFLNLRPWLRYLRGGDLFLGGRIHGTITAILAGVPGVLVPFEARARELAEFHGLPMLEPDRVSGGDGLRAALSSLDYSAMYSRQGENFERYVDFWHRNSVKTVFDDGKVNGPEDFPLERQLPTEFPDDDIRAYGYNGLFRRTGFACARVYYKGREKLRGFSGGKKTGSAR